MWFENKLSITSRGWYLQINSRRDRTEWESGSWKNVGEKLPIRTNYYLLLICGSCADLWEYCYCEFDKMFPLSVHYCPFVLPLGFLRGPDTYVPAQSRTARQDRYKGKGAQQWKCGEAARKGGPSPIKHVLLPMVDFWLRAPRHVTCYLSQKKKATWLERNCSTLRHKLSEVIVISLVRDFTSRSPNWVSGISEQSAVGNGETRNGNLFTKWSPMLYRAILFQEMIPWTGFAEKALFVSTVWREKEKIGDVN